MCNLDVFGSHKLKELVRDPSNFIDFSLRLFQWVENLKERKYIDVLIPIL